ncbi:MAG: MGMT family protein [bacterium]|nr:MGMT family protein [bacterium]
MPCHRVVASSGDLGGFAWGRRRKAELLRAEGVAVDRWGRVPRSAFVVLPALQPTR